ncbi:MAG: hypothetical protein ACYC8T_13910, partial [Myxococcaceae bacterium]
TVVGCGPGTTAPCATGCCSGTGASAICLLGNTSTNCGKDGAACTTCNSSAGQTCTAQVCTGAPLAFGEPCATAADCAGLGTGAICKLTTNPGGATYAGGYCTKPCTSATDPVCGTNAFCVSLIASYGENDRFCWKRCAAPTDCRDPGYACYTVGSNDGCWLDPLPQIDAGPPSDKVGLACIDDPACQAPPDDGFCIKGTTPDGGASGFTEGYCSAPCDNDPNHCGDGGSCFTLGTPPNDFSACLALCSGPGIGQGSCRTGYVCDTYTTTFADGGTGNAFDGVCWPDCHNPGRSCGTQTCGDAGYCE